MRLWVAQSGTDARVHIGPSILDDCRERLFRVNNTHTHRTLASNHRCPAWYSQSLDIVQSRSVNQLLAEGALHLPNASSSVFSSLTVITVPNSYYSAPDRGADYCDERVCLSVCVCVCLSAIISSELLV